MLPRAVPFPQQAKEGGKKTVVTLSSSMAQLERLAVDARVPGKPLGPFDTAQFAYKVSKTGLNQGAPPASIICGSRLHSICNTLKPPATYIQTPSDS